jgi:hypothetical protein
MTLHEADGDTGQTDLELAVHLAELAGPIALSHFRGDNRTWSKSDGSPVSAAWLGRMDRDLCPRRVVPAAVVHGPPARWR